MLVNEKNMYVGYQFCVWLLAYWTCIELETFTYILMGSIYFVFGCSARLFGPTSRSGIWHPISLIVIDLGNLRCGYI